MYMQKYTTNYNTLGNVLSAGTAKKLIDYLNWYVFYIAITTG